MVYVLNQDGQPLMPTNRHGKVKHLLKSGKPTGKIKGFKKFDKVSYFGKEYIIKGRMSSGYAILMDADGNKIDFSDMPKGYKTPKLSNLKRISARRSVITTIA